MQKNLCLLFLVFGVVCLFTSRSEATPYKIKDLIGPLHIVPTELSGMDTPRGIKQLNEEILIFGMHQQKAALQRLDLRDPSNPVLMPFILFNSLETHADSVNGDPRGVIDDAELIGGEVLYFGTSASPQAVHYPGSYPMEGTIWDSNGNPRGIGFPNPNDRVSDINDVSSDGIFTGIGGGATAYVGSAMSGEIKLLPSSYINSSMAFGISSDGKYISGIEGIPSAGVWMRADESSLDYINLNLQLELPLDGSFNQIRGMQVIEDPYLGDVFLGEYVSSETFDWQLAAWQLDTGNFIKTFGPGTTLADTLLIEDTWVVGFNLAGDAGLGTLHDPALIYLSELPEFQAIDNPRLVALYAGSLGIFANDPSGLLNFHLASFYPSGYVPPDPDLPEPSTAVLLVVGLICLYCSRRFWRRDELSHSMIKLL